MATLQVRQDPAILFGHGTSSECPQHQTMTVLVRSTNPLFGAGYMVGCTIRFWHLTTPYLCPPHRANRWTQSYSTHHFLFCSRTPGGSDQSNDRGVHSILILYHMTVALWFIWIRIRSVMQSWLKTTAGHGHYTKSHGKWALTRHHRLGSKVFAAMFCYTCFPAFLGCWTRIVGAGKRLRTPFERRMGLYSSGTLLISHQSRVEPSPKSTEWSLPFCTCVKHSTKRSTMCFSMQETRGDLPHLRQNMAFAQREYVKRNV